MPFSAPVLTYRAKALASNMCSKVLNGHIILTDTSITTILAPEMTYTPKIIGTFVGRNKPILVQCAECNRIWHAWPGSLLKGGGCKVCKSKQAIRQRNRKIRCITTGEIFNTLREAAEKYNVSPSSVCICCTNPPKRKHAGGLEWEYILI